MPGAIYVGIGQKGLLQLRLNDAREGEQEDTEGARECVLDMRATGGNLLEMTHSARYNECVYTVAGWVVSVNENYTFLWHKRHEYTHVIQVVARREELCLYLPEHACGGSGNINVVELFRRATAHPRD